MKLLALVGPCDEAPGRVDDWREIMGRTGDDGLRPAVPVKRFHPEPCRLPIGVRWVLEVDDGRLDADQRWRLVRVLARRFGVPEAEVLGSLDVEPVSILADNVTVTAYEPGDRRVAVVDYTMDPLP